MPAWWTPWRTSHMALPPDEAGEAPEPVPEPAPEPAPEPPSPAPGMGEDPAIPRPAAAAVVVTPPRLVKSARAFADAVRALVDENDAIVFYNCSREFRIIVRNDPIDDETGCVEVGILIDRGSSTLCKLTVDGFLDDDAVVVNTTNFPRYMLDDDATAGPALEELIEAVNDVFEWTVCPACTEHFVKSEAHDVCVYCRMVCREGDLDRLFCAVCQSDGSKMLFERLPCCGNDLHAKCARKCSGKCPLCRGTMQQHHRATVDAAETTDAMSLLSDVDEMDH